MVDAQAVWQALGTVEDPELPLSIVDMGLVYNVDVRQGTNGPTVVVDMTFTAMGCPAMDLLRGDVVEAVGGIDGVQGVHVNVVWDPPWNVSRLTERARETLRLSGVSV